MSDRKVNPRFVFGGSDGEELSLDGGVTPSRTPAPLTVDDGIVLGEGAPTVPPVPAPPVFGGSSAPVTVTAEDEIVLGEGAPAVPRTPVAPTVDDGIVLGEGAPTVPRTPASSVFRPSLSGEGAAAGEDDIVLGEGAPVFPRSPFSTEEEGVGVPSAPATADVFSAAPVTPVTEDDIVLGEGAAVPLQPSGVVSALTVDDGIVLGESVPTVTHVPVAPVFGGSSVPVAPVVEDEIVLGEGVAATPEAPTPPVFGEVPATVAPTVDDGIVLGEGTSTAPHVPVAPVVEDEITLGGGAPTVPRMPTPPVFGGSSGSVTPTAEDEIVLGEGTPTVPRTPVAPTMDDGIMLGEGASTAPRVPALPVFGKGAEPVVDDGIMLGESGSRVNPAFTLGGAGSSSSSTVSSAGEDDIVLGEVAPSLPSVPVVTPAPAPVTVTPPVVAPVAPTVDDGIVLGDAERVEPVLPVVPPVVDVPKRAVNSRFLPPARQELVDDGIVLGEGVGGSGERPTLVLDDEPAATPTLPTPPVAPVLPVAPVVEDVVGDDVVVVPGVVRPVVAPPARAVNPLFADPTPEERVPARPVKKAANPAFTSPTVNPVEEVVVEPVKPARPAPGVKVNEPEPLMSVTVEEDLGKKVKKPAAKTKKKRSPFSLQERDVTLLRFLTKYQFSYVDAIARVLGSTPLAIGNRLRVMEEHELVKRQRIAAGATLWRTRKAGIEICGLNFKESKGEISFATIRHTVGLVNIAAELEREREDGVDILGLQRFGEPWPVKNRYPGGIRLWDEDAELTWGEMTVSEREIRQGQKRYRGGKSSAEMRELVNAAIQNPEAPELEEGNEGMFVVYGSGGKTGEHVPDLVVARPRAADGSPQHFAIELELNPKPPSEWQRILRAFYENGDMYKRIYYFTSESSIANMIRNADSTVGLGDRLVIAQYHPKNKRQPFLG